MKKLTIIPLLFATIASSACIGYTNKIEPYFSKSNGSESYFMRPVEPREAQGFTKLFNKNWYFSANIKHSVQGSKSVNNCKALTKKIESGYYAEKEYEHSFINAININCGVWYEMAKITSSKVSYISNIFSDSHFAEKAPPEFALIISRDDERRLAKAKSWQEMSKIQKVKKLNSDQAVYYDNSAGIQNLTLMAKGDYNQDGIEDAILYMENSVEGGSYSSTHAYIITRLAENAPYTLLKQL